MHAQIRGEGRARTLSRPSPDASPRGCLRVRRKIRPTAAFLSQVGLRIEFQTEDGGEKRKREKE